MALILHIETATRVCSVALSKDLALLSFRESSSPNTHSTLVTVFINEVLEEAGIVLSRLDAVSVSKGPGSYTGLRIGAAVAKGLCYAQNKPLIAVPTLQAMAVGMGTIPSGSEAPVFLCPMLDARRMEVYCSMYSKDLQELMPTRAVIVQEDSFSEFLGKGPVLFGGEGAEKCRPLLVHQPNAKFASGFSASAAHMIPLSLARFNAGQFEDTAYFEPFYLKEFVAGKPRVKGLQ